MVCQLCLTERAVVQKVEQSGHSVGALAELLFRGADTQDQNIACCLPKVEFRETKRCRVVYRRWQKAKAKIGRILPRRDGVVSAIDRVKTFEVVDHPDVEPLARQVRRSNPLRLYCAARSCVGAGGCEAFSPSARASICETPCDQQVSIDAVAAVHQPILPVVGLVLWCDTVDWRPASQAVRRPFQAPAP